MLNTDGQYAALAGGVTGHKWLIKTASLGEL